MFEVGDRVVCVDDGPFADGYEFLLKKGEKFVVLRSGPQGAYVGEARTKDGFISVGVDNLPLQDFWAEIGVLDSLPGLDLWPATRFRKLRDISQSLRELKELAINCPALEPVARAREGK